MDTPSISIVILNWNGGIKDCIESVSSAMSQDYPRKEVIFVDNGSDDGALAEIAQRFPAVKTFQTGENLGCPGGRNIGAGLANGDILFFLENDGIWASNDTVSRLVQLFVENPMMASIYIAVSGYSTGKIDAPLDSGTASELQSGLYFSSSFRGGASAIRREVFSRLGGFRADFFRQYEERYLSLLIYEAGYFVAYWPERTLRHKGSDYTGKNEAVKRYNCINELKTIRALYPSFVWPAYFLAKSFLWFYRFGFSITAAPTKEFGRILAGNLDFFSSANRPRRIKWSTLNSVNRIRYSDSPKQVQFDRL